MVVLEVVNDQICLVQAHGAVNNNKIPYIVVIVFFIYISNSSW